MGDRTLGQDRNFLSVCAGGVVRLLHPLEIDSGGLVTHCAVSLLTAIISMNGTISAAVTSISVDEAA
jgi:hypothetical protein